MNIDSLWTRQSTWIYVHMDTDNRKIISANTFFNAFSVSVFFSFLVLDFGSFGEANGMRQIFLYIFHFKSNFFFFFFLISNFVRFDFLWLTKNRDYLCVVSVFFSFFHSECAWCRLQRKKKQNRKNRESSYNKFQFVPLTFSICQINSK